MKDLREMECLYHVDMDPAKHDPNHTIEQTLGFAWQILKDHCLDMNGCHLVLALVKDKPS